LDGSEAGLLRANVAFRAVAVPAGHHHIEFFYRPGTLVVGAWTSVLILLLAGWLAFWRRPEKTPLRA
jgi:uncharacterized membrane protein YfhO